MHVNAWAKRAWELAQDALPMRTSISRVGPGTGNNPHDGMMLIHVDDYHGMVKMAEHDADLRRFILRRTVVLIVPINQFVQLHTLQYSDKVIASVLKESEIFEDSSLLQEAICPIQLSSRWVDLYEKYGPVMTPEWDQRISLRSFVRMPAPLVAHAEACQGCSGRTVRQLLAINELAKKERRLHSKMAKSNLSVEDLLGAIFGGGPVNIDEDGASGFGISDQPPGGGLPA